MYSDTKNPSLAKINPSVSMDTLDTQFWKVSGQGFGRVILGYLLLRSRPEFRLDPIRPGIPAIFGDPDPVRLCSGN